MEYKGLITVTIRHPKDIDVWLLIVELLETGFDYPSCITEQLIMDESKQLIKTGKYIIKISDSYEKIKKIMPLLRVMATRDPITFETEDTELEDLLYCDLDKELTCSRMGG